MKANELRIGNLVTDSIGILEIGENAKIEFCDIYNPITLTEDILLKCGFDKIDNEFYYTLISNEFYIKIEDSKNVFWVYFDEQPNHPITCVFNLHQLQNLYFALTENELNVTKIKN